MKQLLLFLTFLFSLNVFAQNLTLSEVLAIRKMELGNADDYLMKKGWQFISAEETEDGYNTATYAYKKSTYDDTANSFFYYSYKNYSNMKVVSVQIHTNEKFNNYINQIKAWGGKMITSYIEDGDVVKIYKGSSMSYFVKTTTQTNSFEATVSTYLIRVYANEDLEQ